MPRETSEKLNQYKTLKAKNAERRYKQELKILLIVKFGDENMSEEIDLKS